MDGHCVCQGNRVRRRSATRAALRNHGAQDGVTCRHTGITLRSLGRSGYLCWPISTPVQAMRAPLWPEIRLRCDDQQHAAWTPGWGRLCPQSHKHPTTGGRAQIAAATLTGSAFPW